MKFVDLTQTFSSDMPVYPGDPKSELKQIAVIEKEGFVDHRLNTAMHVGTHMDAPWHMIANGKKISQIDADNFFGHGILVDARGRDKIGLDLLENIQISEGDIVLVLTGFGQKFHDTDYYEKYPELTEAFANKMVELKVKLIGMDIPSPDRPPFKVHKIFLGNEILILENLTNLQELLNQEFEVVALPAKFHTEAAPVRVIAKII